MSESEMIVKVSEYKSQLEYAKKNILRIFRENIKNGEVTSETIDYLNTTLEDHFKNAVNISKEILNDIDIFSKDVVATDREEIIEEIKDLKNKFKKLKIYLKEEYNKDVSLANKKMDYIMNNPEARLEVEGLVVPSKCEKKVRQFGTKLRLQENELNYQELEKVNEKINEVCDKFNIQFDEMVYDFRSDIEQIDSLIAEVENDMLSINNIEVNITKQELEDMLNTCENMASSLKVRLNRVKDKMSEEDYNDAFADVANAYTSVNRIRQQLDGIQVKVYDNEAKNLYNYIKTDILNIDERIKTYEDETILPMIGLLHASDSSVFEDKINEYDKKLVEIRKSIDEAHENGKLDDLTYNNLLSYLDSPLKTLEGIKDTVNNPKSYKEEEKHEVINTSVDKINEALDKLEKVIETTDKPIKKEQRRDIDKLINAIARRIELLELDQKDSKDNELQDKINNYKERLNDIEKKYRKKCPFLVKSVKSAKDFYKKHKKVVLVAAGLAAIAITHATVGPVIIPAIMHGNLMIKTAVGSVPLGRAIASINMILGNLINAKFVQGYWYLANGVCITPAIASTSLLKGIAISGIGSAVMAAPVVTSLVVGVKKLTEKMNMSELKQRLTKEKKTKETKSNPGIAYSMGKAYGKLARGISDKKENVIKTVKEKTKPSVKKNNGKVTKLVLDDITKLIAEFKKSKLTVEEFAKERDLSEADIELLTNYAKRLEDKNIERGGRK